MICMKFARKPAPSADELRRLYVDEGLTMKAIGTRWNMHPSSVLHRLRDAGIATRSPGTPMTKTALATLIEQGMYQAAIARHFGRTPGAVKIALRKHGLRAPDGHGRGERRRAERIRFSGYWMLYRPEHPHADKRGRIMEHRLVMEGVLGRYLRHEEVVHHMNHVRDDNRPENLMLLPDQAAHQREHHPKGKAIADGNKVRWGR